MTEVITLSDSNFDEITQNSELPYLVDLWAVWCMPCRKVAPIVKELAVEYDGKMNFAKLDVDHNPKTAQKYKVLSIPMFLILFKGEVLVSFIGALPKKKMVEKVELALKEVKSK